MVTTNVTTAINRSLTPLPVSDFRLFSLTQNFTPLCIHWNPEWKITIKFKTDGPKLLETEASSGSLYCNKNDRLQLIVYCKW
jgi:hypothetical protein